ncbi:iron chelate uptake ABC transporter family permease subunit [Pantoea allii]|uniref:iron chelate uptake ABC transporter family permease subunit n=1 Tax=Pantoea allii TaxID=574096 RepID=UPI000A23D26A|nr:iron chelate uptake ABC transporter family permease subunit [Pantoea allii]MBW1253698.1 iron chelate uptake ABC transporter family permease subunit [Pantoea allii]MBW1262821.1 iron chelate uptake ABC transporter family permease subunit [Pantoea allii]MBW1285378.1 iron chelate uptake ABC transporter family permease subunit [Pantoea allii]ORM82884.1 enterobactin ABC transporter permease [Pantoea allii]PBJ97790.1 enterobactin ABC transporter permease [Pantoea allii]
MPTDLLQPSHAPRAAQSPVKRLWILALLAVVLSLVFMTLHLQGNISYILKHRGQILLTIVLVAFASGISTLLFQTITQNRILSPSVMGLESLFVFLQTLLVFFIQLSQLSQMGSVVQFLGETALLMIFATLLYRWLFNRSGLDLHRVLLTGLVFGTLFRSLSGLMQRLLSPGEFAVLQSRMFATFTHADAEVLAISAMMIVAITVIVWRLRHRLDVIALGRNSATALGVPYQHYVTGLLLLISLLVAISTALVGPMTFLGLLVVNLAWPVVGSWRHGYLLPGAILIGIIMLTGGQLLLEQLFNMAGTLSVIIEFFGGGLFIYLVLKKVAT